MSKSATFPDKSSIEFVLLLDKFSSVVAIVSSSFIASAISFNVFNASGALSTK